MTASIRSSADAFREVRDLPYAIDGAHDADALAQIGAGDCLAKSELLGRRLLGLGRTVRFVRWLYMLPAVVPQVDFLPERLDVHRALEVHHRGRWLLVDPTHAPHSPPGA